MIVNIIIFAFTHGYVNSMSFFFASRQAEPKFKGRAGASISFFICVGIYGGSLLAIISMKNFA
jgi:hypothetical protein